MGCPPDLDVFVENKVVIDEEIFQMWIDGREVGDAAKQLEDPELMQEFGASYDMLIADVNHHYHLFAVLEQSLHFPKQLIEQWTLQLHPDTQSCVIERYYSIHDLVMREILGKKLSSRNRKDLDEVCEKTGVSITSCRKYAAMVFMCNNRFETNKRKLACLSFDDFVTCAWAMMASWVSIGSESRSDFTDLELDREFLQELRDLKILQEKEKEHRSATQELLKKAGHDAIVPDAESSFKTLNRGVISIAMGLLHGRELRDFFVDVVEKIVEPLKAAKWSSENLGPFLMAYSEGALQVEILKNSSGKTFRDMN
ncbi:unnamed protein product [Darwinula stevensoni]|uniref:Acidic fibroblast growth factor intracellular-binding protein n=1 Tax=Darwinula stevensoni TaxID=69355 RepID=A0A7R8X792_9CRUS|nr:unnamed protein product [Darwinula stevensoni]CAG0882966.1 unnamed protein product [Darwinula stevensoni]